MLLQLLSRVPGIDYLVLRFGTTVRAFISRSCYSVTAVGQAVRLVPAAHESLYFVLGSAGLSSLGLPFRKAWLSGGVGAWRVCPAARSLGICPLFLRGDGRLNLVAKKKSRAITKIIEISLFLPLFVFFVCSFVRMFVLLCFLCENGAAL